MGWKGFVRSVGASSRRAALHSERRQRAVARAHGKADNFMSRLDAEVEKEIQKVAAWEAKLAETPIKSLALSYSREEGWTTKPLSDKTGIITYDLTLKPGTIDGALFDPISADLGKGVQLTPLAVCLCDRFTAVAFWAAVAGDAARTIKLVNKASPETSRIAIADPDGETYLPLETNLDGRLFGGTGRIGVVAFEAFTEGVSHFDVLIAGGQDEETTQRIRATDPDDLRAGIEKQLAQPGILDQFVEGIRKTQVDTRAKAEEVKRKAASGCVVPLLAFLGSAAWLVWP